MLEGGHFAFYNSLKLYRRLGDFQGLETSPLSRPLQLHINPKISSATSAPGPLLLWAAIDRSDPNGHRIRRRSARPGRLGPSQTKSHRDETNTEENPERGLSLFGTQAPGILVCAIGPSQTLPPHDLLLRVEIPPEVVQPVCDGRRVNLLERPAKIIRSLILATSAAGSSAWRIGPGSSLSRWIFLDLMAGGDLWFRIIASTARAAPGPPRSIRPDPR